MIESVVHRAAGLTIAADRRIPGLALATPNGPPDVLVHLHAPATWSAPAPQPHYAAEHTDRLGRPIVTVDRTDRGFHFRYADGTNVWVADDARDVWCAWPAEATLEDTATYLTGPVLGFLLRRRGIFALHASGVRVGDGALVLVGPHGSGKSTTAVALGRRGCAVIADDIVRLAKADGTWLAQPFGGVVRLWPEGVRLALGPGVGLPRLTPNWDKRGLELGTHGVAGTSASVPVRAVAFLEPREASPRAPCLQPVGGADALVRFATNSAAAQLLDERSRASEFALLGELTASVACTRATAAESEDLFPAFIDRLHEWALERCAHGE